tara:strand:- start:4534 stop:5295 length:762 start_codon:yes stop_codon:yes gene_type:complete
MLRSRIAAAGLTVGALLAFGAAAPASAASASEAVTAADAECEIVDASLTWGFKESFRAYIDGSIANGEWTTDGAVSYATPDFTWEPGAGSLDPEADTAELRFSGGIRFTGHGGILDTTFSDPIVRVEADGSAHVVIDVTGTTRDGEQITASGVDFLSGAAESTVDDGQWTLVIAAPILTEDGAEAFPDYPAGAEFDAMTITAGIDETCAEALVAAAEARELPTRVGLIAGGATAAAALAVLVVGLVRRRGAQA